MVSVASNLSAQYSITHSTWRHDYQVDGTHVLHVDNSTMRLGTGKPDMTFHSGSDNNGQIAGVVRFRHLSSDTEIGFGDPNQSSKIDNDWECMSRQGVWKSTYHFQTEVGDDKPHSFTWKPTKSMGSGRAGDLKLVDDGTQEVVAVFLASGSIIKKTGQLDIYANYGERFQLMVLMSGLAIREKQRRSSNSASIGAASAGNVNPIAGIGGF